MYEEGLKHYNEREVLRRNAPIEKECTFSPTFFTKGLKEEGVAFGKGLSERGAAASKMLNTSVNKSSSSVGIGSPGPRVVSLKELREESGMVAAKEEKEVRIEEETKKQLESLEKE